MDEHLQRALELAEGGRGTTHPNPVVGAIVVQDGRVVGEGWHARAGGPHAEVIALEAADGHARGSTLYVTMEPCAHHGRTPPCVDAVLAAGVRRVVAGCLDPGVDSGGGLERLRASGIDVQLVDAFECRAQNEAWRTWVTESRPFVTYKVAMTLGGRVSVPGSRWVSGEESRRLVHELRASVDSVAVGIGTVRADDPRLDAREVNAARQPRRLAFGRGPLPDGSQLELRSGTLVDELAALAAEGVQSLLLEGGPTLATAFLEHGFVDKLLVFIAPRLAGAGPFVLGDLTQPMQLSRTDVQSVGDDVLLSAYVHEP